MKKTSLIFLITGLLAVIISAVAFAEERAEEALRATLTAPVVSYEGTLTVTHWFGKEARAENIRVSFRPPANYRWEFLNPDGSLHRVIVSDGKNEVVHFVEHGKKLTGGAVKNVPRAMPPENEWALLRKNYRILSSGAGDVAGRAVWLIRVEPLENGKLIQELALDKQTGVVLDNKRSRPHGDFAVRSQFQHFVVVRSIPDETFVVLSDGSLEDHQFAPDFLSKEHWSTATGRTTRLPDLLPFGFALESVDYFLVDGKNVDHFRYTDGLTTVSVFETKHPLKTKSIHAISEEGNMLPLKKGDKNYMLVGDTSMEMLKDLARAFP